MNLSTVAGLVTALTSSALSRLGVTSSSVSSPTVTATTAVILGAPTTAGVRLKVSGGHLIVAEGDDSNYGPRITAAGLSCSAGGFIAAGSYVVGDSSDVGLSRVAANTMAVTNASSVVTSLTGGATTITDNTATSLFTIALASGAFCGGTIRYSILVTNGTDHQVRTGMMTFSAVDKAGVLTSAIDEAAGQSIAVSAGTLTDAWTILDGSNAITIRLTADSSLTPTAMTVRWNADIFGSATTVTVP